MSALLRGGRFQRRLRLLQRDKSSLHVGLPGFSGEVAEGKRSENGADDNDGFGTIHSEPFHQLAGQMSKRERADGPLEACGATCIRHELVEHE